MFSKPAKPHAPRSDLPEASPSRKAIAASLIAENVSLEGDLASDGDVHLDGKIRGDLRVGRLTVGETGQVDGAIVAEAVDIRGRVSGTVTAPIVRLHATARVDGDITQTQLVIEAGAHFEGRSLPYQPPVQAETLSLIAAAE